jgi:transcriptional regulator with XRE-family HTH domain
VFWRVEGAELGVVIRARRRARRQSIEALAREAGMHPTYLGVIERGRGNPTWDKLSDLAEALEVPVSTLAREAEDHRIQVAAVAAHRTARANDERKEVSTRAGP